MGFPDVTHPISLPVVSSISEEAGASVGLYDGKLVMGVLADLDNFADLEAKVTGAVVGFTLISLVEGLGVIMAATLGVEIVGAWLGFNEGNQEGFEVGFTIGFVVGNLEGNLVWILVTNTGDIVGVTVSNLEGNLVGGREGFEVGTWLGFIEG